MNRLLAKQQCGYRANRSTVDHLIHLETFTRDAFIQNRHFVAVFFDLQRHMILHGNMASNKAYMMWAYEGICPLLLVIF